MASPCTTRKAPSRVVVNYWSAKYGRGCPQIASYSAGFGVNFLSVFFGVFCLLTERCKMPCSADFSMNTAR